MSAALADPAAADPALPAAAADGGAPWPDSRRAWYTIWLIAFVTLLANIDRAVINLLVQPMKVDLQLSDTQVSLIVGLAFSAFYFITGFPMSRISDSHSRKWVIGIGLLCWSAATALCGLVRSFTTLFIARGIVGAAESTPGPAAMSMMSDLVPREKLPRAFAVYQLGIGLGQGSALIIGGLLIGFFANYGLIHLPFHGEMAPWQLVFISCGLPGLVVAILWLCTVREPARRNRMRKGSVPLRDLGRFLAANKALYLPMFLSIAIGSIEMMGAAVWRAPMFERSYGWTPAQVGPLFGMTAIAIMPISLIGGTWLAERLIRKGDPQSMLKVSLIAGLLSLPFQVIAPLLPDPWWCWGLLTLSMIIGGMSGPALNSAIQYATPNEMRAQVSSLYLYTISVVGTTLGPLVVALVGDFVLRDESLLYLSMSGFVLVLSPFASLFMWFAMRAFGRVMEAQEAARG